MKILIMGLPGSGKSWLGERLSKNLKIPYWDADVVRTTYGNDYDMSMGGRIIQAERMRKLAELDPVSISGFVCPLPGLRYLFGPDLLIWMDTIKESKYEDTNKLFHPPTKIYDLRITKWIDENQLFKCLEDFNLGTVDIENFSKELTQRLAKWS
tara:strand:+ start:129 stop:590 length:462 start_codon:yes stop_codon:yes gene_type:complete